MGVVCHYVCDYFCYSHSPAFQGNLWDHIKYEWVQRMPDAGEISFCRREGPSADFSPFMDTLDAYIRNHDREPRRDAASAQTDITTGMAAAEWLTETVFCSAERLFFSPVVPFRRMPFLWARLFSGRRTA
jgi:hypothetical protein